MLEILNSFRERLDDVMIKAIGKRVVLYGYDRTGQFLEWYADYYHGIKIDYIIIKDWSPDLPPNFPLFSDDLFEFNYKDIKNTIVWVAIPVNEDIEKQLKDNGYKKNDTWYSFLELIYGKNYMISAINETEDVFSKRKSGKRDVQFMEWLEHIYGCNLVEHIYSCYFEDKGTERISYVISTQKEIFPVLDRCHCTPQENDAIFDFGCGKGGALISFLDYGFKKVGGVEFERKIFDIMISNFKKLGIDPEGEMLSCIHGDAMDVTTELDLYNWFYYFEPFKRKTFAKTIDNIIESLKRRPRKIHIININPRYYDVILESGFFVLTNQFWIATRKKVVDVFVSKKEYE